MLRWSAFIVASVAVVVVGCPGPAEGEGDVGEGEGGEGEGGEGEGDVGEGEGEGDAGAGEGEGEGEGDVGEEGEGDAGDGEGEGEGEIENPCLSAAPLVDGDVVAGATVVSGALTCDERRGAGPDVAYSFVLDDAHGVVLRAVSDDVEVFVSLYGDDSCVDDIDSEFVCRGGDDGVGELRLGLLSAGRYFVVVDTDSAGDFTVSFDVSDPFCDGDAGDPGDDVPAGATQLGRTDAAFAQELCTDDEDWFVVEHVGGVLNVDDEGTVAVVDVFATNVDVDASRDEGALVVDGPGAPVVTGGVVDRGAYLVRVAGDGSDLGLAGAGYLLRVAHGCDGDSVDRGVAELDDEAEFAQVPQVLPRAPVARALCGDDVDLALVDVVFPGTLTFIVDGGAQTVELFSVGPGDVLTPLATTADGAGRFSTDVDDPGLVAARIGGGATIDTPYTWSFELSSLDDAPANDRCDDALVIGDGETVVGRTAGAVDDGAVTCSGGETGADVFFRFHLDDEAGIALGVAALDDVAALPRFALVQLLPGPNCPSDLSEVTPVLVDDQFGEPAPLCIEEPSITRVRAIAAGDYLVVADDRFAGTDGSVFSLSLDLVPGGFPRACSNPGALTLPAPGAPPLVLTLQGDTFFLDAVDVFNFTSRGDERAFVVRPTEAGTLTVRTREEADAAVDSDTVLAVRRDDCFSGAFVGANDDDDSAEFDSVVSVDVEAGVDYFVIVDHFFADEPAAGDVVELEVSFDD